MAFIRNEWNIGYFTIFVGGFRVCIGFISSKKIMNEIISCNILSNIMRNFIFLIHFYHRFFSGFFYDILGFFRLYGSDYFLEGYLFQP